MLNGLTPDVKLWRRELRPRLVAARLKIPPEEHRKASLRIEGFLDEVFQGFPHRSLSLYWPFQGEVDLRPFAARLRGRGWVAALPLVVRPRAPLEFLRWDEGAEMDRGVYDIPIPRVRHPIVPEVVIAPLIGFDRGNHRLGFGGGFYDITLGGMRPRPATVGVGFEIGRLETIRPAATDIPLDYIVTEEGIQGPRTPFA
jgi:5,10-methenyltetrahydrofolate synthetase